MVKQHFLSWESLKSKVKSTLYTIIIILGPPMLLPGTLNLLNILLIGENLSFFSKGHKYTMAGGQSPPQVP